MRLKHRIVSTFKINKERPKTIVHNQVDIVHHISKYFCYNKILSNVKSSILSIWLNDKKMCIFVLDHVLSINKLSNNRSTLKYSHELCTKLQINVFFRHIFLRVIILHRSK